MTVKLFWNDAYQTECKAIVTSIEGSKVKLNQTIFYAFSGGQESDEGTIGGIKVQEAEKEGDKEDIIDIEYTLEQAPYFKVGDEVEVKINSERRDRLRRLHSALHILYYIVVEKLGKVKINGSHVAEDKGRMDFGYKESIGEQIPFFQEELNKEITANREIRREPDPKKTDLKWWVLGEWRMPCGGTHVKSTGEIGIVELRRVNKGKGRERIEVFLKE